MNRLQNMYLHFVYDKQLLLFGLKLFKFFQVFFIISICTLWNLVANIMKKQLIYLFGPP